MRHTAIGLLVTTAISGLFPSTAFADPDFTAAIATAPSTVEYLTPDKTYAVPGPYGLISGAINFTPVLGTQGDVLYRYSSHHDYDSNREFTSLDVALHAFYRDPDRFLLGGFVQFGETEQTTHTGPVTYERSLIGAEGQVFFDQFTFYGQLGRHHTSAESTIEYDASFITAELRYFVTPDFKLEVHAGHIKGRLPELQGFPVPGRPEATNLGLGAEYRLPSLPVSVFGRYDHTSMMDILDSPFESHRVLAGVKFNLGDDSLQERDRTGASLRPVDLGNNFDPVSALLSIY